MSTDFQKILAEDSPFIKRLMAYLAEFSQFLCPAVKFHQVTLITVTRVTVAGGR